MNKFALLVSSACSLLLLCSASLASAAEMDCKALQDQKNLIYAAHGYCFSDPDAQKQYGTDCNTKKPKFSEAEQKRLVELEAQLKSKSCPKKD